MTTEFSYLIVDNDPSIPYESTAFLCYFDFPAAPRIVPAISLHMNCLTRATPWHASHPFKADLDSASYALTSTLFIQSEDADNVIFLKGSLRFESYLSV